MFRFGKAFLFLLFLFVSIHLLKDITQDILKIKTPLDFIGNLNEDLSFLPPWAQFSFTYGLGSLSICAEAFLLITIPRVLQDKASLRLKKWVWTAIIFLALFFIVATFLDPRFKVKF